MVNFGTGINGFIGSHLSKKIDITPIPHTDIQTTEYNDFDRFFFLSSYGNLASHTDEEAVYKANVLDLLETINRVKDKSFNSFVYLSSSAVMLKTQTTYSRTKRIAEEILFAYMERHNLPICIIRPFSVTGVGEQKEHLIPTLINAAFTGKTVNLVPNATHDYIDVDDVAEGILSLSKNKARGLYQLGTGIKTSNREVLELVEKVTGKKINVNIVQNMRTYDSNNWVSNNFKARGYGWLPKKSLEQSIKEMVEAYEFK